MRRQKYEKCGYTQIYDFDLDFDFGCWLRVSHVPVRNRQLLITYLRFCGVNITNGIIISSIEMPPCWKVFL